MKIDDDIVIIELTYENQSLLEKLTRIEERCAYLQEQIRTMNLHLDDLETELSENIDVQD
jgi:hypothetical protein